MHITAKKYSRFSTKFLVTLFICLAVRLIPLRAPNIEPIMSAVMPMGRAFGAMAGFSFGALSIFLYDIVTGTLGLRTIFTAGIYGLIGMASVFYFKRENINKWSYVKFAIAGTLFFDAVTGLALGPIFFNQSFVSAFIGQIPFTALHLAGNAVFAYALSPGLYHFLVKKKSYRLVDTKSEPSLLTISNFN